MLREAKCRIYASERIAQPGVRTQRLVARALHLIRHPIVAG